MITSGTIEDKMRAIVGAEHFRAATPSDAVMGVQPRFVAEPASEQELAAVLSSANETGLAVIPRGGGTKLGWGNPPKRADLVLSTLRLDRILEYAWADLTATVEAGCILQRLQEKLAQHRQRLALDGLWPEQATIGGALSTNDSGVLRLRFGALRDLIIGVTLALPDGTLASSGGKVVKNVAGYDLPKLATGAFGTLGVITRAVFRLHPLPSGTRTISFTTRDSQEMQAHILAIQDSKLAHTALQMRCTAASQPCGDILFEGTETGIQAQGLQLRKLLGSTSAELSSNAVWSARQDLWAPDSVNALIAKVSVLPTEIAETTERLKEIAGSGALRWQFVAQATGIGVLRLEGELAALSTAVSQLRAHFESGGGSLVVLRRPRELNSLDVWGGAGDAVNIMRSLKQGLDPQRTLNTGRFVEGI